MLTNWCRNFKKDIKKMRRKYALLKIKWILLFVLPILAVVLAYQVSKQYLKLRIQNLDTKIKENKTHHDTDSNQGT